MVVRITQDETQFTEAVRRQLLDAVYVEPRIIWMNLVLIVVVGCVGMLRLDSAWPLLWTTAGVSILALRIYDFHHFMRSRQTASIGTLEKRYIIGSWMIGLHWGSASAILVLTDDPVSHFWFVNSLSAFLALAVARSSPVLPAALGQIFCTLTPVLLTCLLSADYYLRAYSLLSVIYIAGTLGVARHLHAQTVRLLVLDATNVTLLDDVRAAKTKIELINRDLAAQATTDGLTGISNRRSFDNKLADLWMETSATGRRISLLLIDIDHFKSYNDQFGHLAGDDCLKRVAGAIRHSLVRNGDFFARYGGEEFVVLLPGASNHLATMMAERARSAVQDMALPAADGSHGVVTVSIGIATIEAPDPRMDAETLLSHADEELYRAKKSGRNRTSGSTPIGGIFHASDGANRIKKPPRLPDRALPVTTP